VAPLEFFIPHLQDDSHAVEAEWTRYLAESPAPRDSKRVYSMAYEHEESKFVVTVGKARIEYVRRTGPRGGYIRDADYVRRGQDTGTVVSGIVDTGGDLLYVWSYGPRFGGWANPSLVGRGEVTSLEYFDHQ
jgi:hypothetical protein